MVVDVAAWLRGLGLGLYEEVFRAHAVDGEVLPQLTAEDLKEIGVGPVGHRRKLLAAIAALRQEPAAPVPAEPERRQVTVLFCDLVGSTPLAAALDPEDLREVISAYHAAAAAAIAPWEGHIAKYLGDGVLAYWGWPRAHEDAAERAARAGLALIETIRRLRPKGELVLRARVGIATGRVVVGDLIGKGAARAEVVGETPNLAARLQALAEPDAVVVADTTRRLIGDRFAWEDLGQRHLKGFPAPVRAWRLLGEQPATDAREPVPAAALPLVGREREMTLLLDRWALARAGSGQVVLLVGEPGIGKSRLTDALRQQLLAEGCIERRYACSPLRETSTLHPVLPELEREAGFAKAEPRASRLAKLAASLGLAGADLLAVADLLGVVAGEERPPGEPAGPRRKERALELLAGHLLRGPPGRPRLLVLEDAYWADPTSLELLGRLAAQVPSLPALLVVTSRPGFTIPTWSGSPHALILPLGRLGREESAALAAEAAGGRALPAAALVQILERADGIPLFIEELTKAVVEADGRGDHPDATPVIPETLQDSLMARLDRLGRAKQVAQMAAVIGQSFSLELLSAVLPWPPPELQAALRSLREAGLVQLPGDEGRADYGFRHALLREVAYETLLRGRRRQLHAKVAEALRQRFPGTPPELLAQHLARAGAVREAAGQWLAAGELSLRQAAPVEATAQLAAGLDLLATLPADPERHRLEARLQLAMGQALSLTRGRAASAVGLAFGRAYELARQEDEAAPELVAALLGLYGFHFLRAELNEARTAADELLRLAEWHGDAGLQVTAMGSAGAIAFFLGRFQDAQASLEAALAGSATRRPPADAARGFHTRLSSLAYLCCALAMLGYPDRARVRSGEAMREAGALGDQPGVVAVALFSDGMVAQLRRDPHTVRERAEALLEMASRHDLPLWLAGATVLRGRALVDQGEIVAGVRAMRQGIAAWRATGAEHLVPWFQALLAEACGAASRPAEGLRLLDDALFRAERTGERWCEAELLRLRGELLLLRAPRHRAAAEASLHRARAVASRQHAPLWELRAATSLARRAAGRNGAKARRLLAPVYERFTEGFDTLDLREARALLEQPDAGRQGASEA
jgi:class 3 adenylate cyclase/predicted ATPase